MPAAAAGIDRALSSGVRLQLCRECDGIYSPCELRPSFSRHLYDDLVDVDKSRQIAQSASKRRLVHLIVADLLQCGASRRAIAEQTLTMLDVGSGWGDLLAAATSVGISGEGVEYSDLKRRDCLGRQQVVHASLGDVPERKVDFIVLWQVLEHLQQPTRLLRELLRFAHDDTVLFVGVPHFSYAIIQRHFAGPPAERSANLNPLEHLTYFDGSTLTSVAERAGWGRLRTTEPLLQRRWKRHPSPLVEKARNLLSETRRQFQSTQRLDRWLGTVGAFVKRATVESA